MYCHIFIIKSYSFFNNSFNFLQDGHHTNYGDDFGKSILQCYEKGKDQIIAVGANCTSPEHIASLLEKANLSLPSAAVLPRVIYSNAGDRWIPGKG